jgi:hypothetical protein
MTDPGLRLKALSTAVAALLLSLAAISGCGGDGDGGTATSGLAEWMPAGSVVYIEAVIRPEDDVSEKVDRIATRLTGESLSDSLNQALAENSDDSEVDFKTDVEPWLGESAALAVTADLSGYSAEDAFSVVPASLPASGSLDISGGGTSDSSEQVSVVVETTDADATRSFIETTSASQKGDPNQGEYEGVEYTVSGDGDSVLGVSDDLLLAADSVAGFESMVDAHDGDSLADTDAFSEVADKAADGSVANMFATSAPVVDAASGSGTSGDSGAEPGNGSGSGMDPLYEALGVDPENTGVLLSLVPGDDEISLKGVSNAGSEFVNGDPGPLIETFPADAMFATGSAGIGTNLRKVIDAVDEQGIEGLVRPGELQKMIDEFSGSGVDLNALIDSLETVGMFVSGGSVDSLGGALVVTSSDLKPLENSLALISTLIGQAGDAQVRPLTGNATGFSARTPELPGRPVVVAIKSDRFVIAIGARQAKQALGGSGSTLAGSDAYEAAVSSLSGEQIDLFVDPPRIGKLIRDAAGEQSDAVKAADLMDKFEYIGAGGSDGDGTFELNLGLGN